MGHKKQKKIREDKLSDEEYEYLSSLKEYSQEQLDKMIVLISSGGLVISVGFVSDIIEITQSTNTLLLKLTWVGFVCSLLFIAFSHQAFDFAVDKSMEKNSYSQNYWDIIAKFLTNLSILTMISSIIFFIVFINKHM